MTKEEAKEAIKEAYGTSEYTDEIIKALSAEPRKMGKWKYSYLEETGECSCCGYEHYLGTYREYSTNYCPNCGAKMEAKT